MSVHVVRGDDTGDRTRESRTDFVWDVGVGEERQRGLRLWEVKHGGLVAEDDAGVPDPAAAVEDAQTVEGGFLGVHRHCAVEALSLRLRCEQCSGAQCARPDPHVVERGDHVSRRPGPGWVPVGGSLLRPVQHGVSLRVGVGECCRGAKLV